MKRSIFVLAALLCALGWDFPAFAYRNAPPGCVITSTGCQVSGILSSPGGQAFGGIATGTVSGANGLKIDLDTGVITGMNPVFTTPNLGTPASATLTNATGLPVSTGLTGLGTGVAAALGAPVTGTGSVVLTNGATLVAPNLGTPASGVGTNLTGIPLATAVTGTLPVTNGGTGVTSSTGSGSVVLSTSPTLVAPNIGTPLAGVLTNATGLPIATGVSGLGTGVAGALSINIGSAGAPVLFNGAGGTPSSLTLTNALGLPIGGLTGLGAGVGTALGTAVTGSGGIVLGTSPTISGATLSSGTFGGTWSGTIGGGNSLSINLGTGAISGGDASGADVTATGTTAPLTLANSVETYDPRRWGAKCNWSPANPAGGTDDSTAINNMFNAIRTADVPFRVVTPNGEICRVNSTINATALNGTALQSSFIELRLYCATTGEPCVDALDTRWISFHHLFIEGDQTDEPTYGIQYGRITTASADQIYFDRPMIIGYFSGADMINMASEGAVTVDPYMENLDTGASRVLIMDGYNHFDVTSQFVTQTNPVDTALPMNSSIFIGGYFQGNSTTDAPIWEGNNRNTEFLGSYSSSTSPYNVEIYETGGQVGAHNVFNMHFETTAVQDIFLLDGANSNYLLDGLRYKDQSPQPSAAVFTTGSGVTAVNAYDLDINVWDFSNGGGNSVKLFSDPSIWTASGDIKLPNVANWTPPAGTASNVGFSGTVCITTACYSSFPASHDLNRNGDFAIDQEFAGASNLVATNGAMIVDGWRESNAGALLSSITFQRTSSGPPSGYEYSELATVTSTKTVGSTDRYVAKSMIEGGASLANLKWGTSLAQPVTLTYCLKASNAGTYNTFLQNGSATESYVLADTVSTANAWQCYVHDIPGDTTAALSGVPNTPGLFIGINYGSGSTYQTTADTWEAGNFSGTAGAFNFLGTASATLQIAAVHLFPDTILKPIYDQRTAAEQLLRAQRFYRKSFVQGTAVAQNAGAPGAITFQLPYADSTFASAGVPVTFPPMYENNGSTLPTITFYSPGAASANCYDSTQAADAGAASAVNEGDAGFYLKCALASGDALGDQIEAQYTADSGY